MDIMLDMFTIPLNKCFIAFVLVQLRLHWHKKCQEWIIYLALPEQCGDPDLTLNQKQAFRENTKHSNKYILICCISSQRTSYIKRLLLHLFICLFYVKEHKKQTDPSCFISSLLHLILGLRHLHHPASPLVSLQSLFLLQRSAGIQLRWVAMIRVFFIKRAKQTEVSTRDHFQAVTYLWQTIMNGYP